MPEDIWLNWDPKYDPCNDCTPVYRDKSLVAGTCSCPRTLFIWRRAKTERGQYLGWEELMGVRNMLPGDRLASDTDELPFRRCS